MLLTLIMTRQESSKTEDCLTDSWLFVLHSVAGITARWIRSRFRLKCLESIVLIINYLFRLMARVERNLESVGVKFKYMPCSSFYRLQSVAWSTTFICVSSLQRSRVKWAENMPREFIKFFGGSSHQRCCLSLIKLLNEAEILSLDRRQMPEDDRVHINKSPVH